MTDTADIIAALEGIRASGPLTPSRVVRVAKSPESTLHPLFEWDDRKAGHQHRLWHARQLIATRITRVAGATRTIRAYIHVPSKDGEGEYVPVQTIVGQPDKLTLARDVAIRALESAQDNIEELDEAVRLFGKPERSERQRAKAQRARDLVKDAHAELVAV